MSRVACWSVLTVLGVVGVASSAAAQDAAKGAMVYEAQKCSVCHSIGGKGNTKGALDAVGTKLTAADIRAWIVDPVGMADKSQGDAKAGDDGQVTRHCRKRISTRSSRTWSR